jgi:hypothetical protein
MRKILLSICIAFSIGASAATAELENKWEAVIKAISYVESASTANAVSPCGRYVGYLQISKILVRQCNIIAGYEKYTYNDRYNIEKSIDMFIEYQERYNPEGNIEKAIRLWNSGDLKCMQNKSKTERYYQRVIKRYNTLGKQEA